MFQINPEIKERLPKHLHKFIVRLPYEIYTEQDHAKWRYVMLMNLKYAKEFAHDFYLKSLHKIHLPTEKIPTIEELNKLVKPFGWHIVAVNGFITPKVFMEFHAEKFLVVASNIRSLKYLRYTPYPDLIHDILGHVPCIVSPEYAEVLNYFGKIGKRAISSKSDVKIHEALNDLSILKEQKKPDWEKVAEKQKEIDALENKIPEISEMEKIRKLHWHSVEYGLMGNLEKPIIYGAGLLSSIHESTLCLTDLVQKKEYSLNAFDSELDITNHQKELRVVKDFDTLKNIVDSYVKKMSISVGGKHGMEKLIDSEDIGTIELENSLQISGIFKNAFYSENQITFIEMKKNIVLAKDSKAIRKCTNLITPFGKIEYFKTGEKSLSFHEIKRELLKKGEKIQINYFSKWEVSGNISDFYFKENKEILFLELENCTLENINHLIHVKKNTIVFGEKIISAYSGVADKDSFEDFEEPTFYEIKYNPTKNEKQLYSYYKNIRDFRKTNEIDFTLLQTIFDFSTKNFPEDWLILFELYELIYGSKTDLEKIVKDKLEELSQNEDFQIMINKGIKYIHEK
ncbi:aromatic amino acid hydroxylase [Aureivirga marina]|uniref:aromatic amino acid hydroxylase n=1 Tax=Aureivirga marina TaxID=1182451 RepID=UPI0018CB09E6|nr:aromatic amino acid hydroxylase [Aureivirga marina]